jgi:hypothetical protein
MRRLLVNKKFGRNLKEAVVATFSWRGEKSNEKSIQCNRSLSRASKTGLPA